MNISVDMPTAAHTQVYDLISNWLQRALRRNVQIGNIKRNQSMHFVNQPLPPLFSTLRKVPDLCIYNRENTRPLVQIEVDSGDLRHTVRKLALGLVDQLRHERNRNDAITYCTGFYFPSNTSCTSVVKVTLSWSDTTTDFRTTNSIVRKRCIIREIVEALQVETLKTINMEESTRQFFQIPLTQSFITETFGEGSVQCFSGYSVVIINNAAKKVFKKSFENSARLYELLREPPLDQCILPKDVNNRYFEFDLVKPPLKCEEAKDCLIQFSSSVKDALASIHEREITHLDIRLENICYDDTCSKALLIDFDRSVPSLMFGSGISYLLESYGNSVMYRIPSTFPPDANHSHVDWRQFGIMLCYILEPNHDYHFTEPTPQNDFLKKLLEEGKYDGTLYDAWVEELQLQ